MPQAARLERADLWIRASGSASTTSLPSLSKTNRTGRIPCIAKHDSIMQQLTLQFEGYADEMRQPQTQGTATQCQSGIVKACELSVGWALKQVNPSAALSQVVARVKLLAQGALCVIFGFSLMFLAALIGG